VGSLYVDVDAVAKLAHWQLLEHLPSLLGVAWSDCGTLGSVVHRASRATEKADGKLFKSTEAAGRAMASVKLMGKPVEPGGVTMSSLQDIAGLDPGEAVLLSAVADEAGSRLLTGDKRAIRALAELDAGVRGPIAGRILVVEQIVLLAFDRFGLAWLRDRVCPFADIDKAIRVVMGGRCDASEVAVREALEAYIQELVGLCDPSLLSAV
jgi:hypothetical protein